MYRIVLCMVALAGLAGRLAADDRATLVRGNTQTALDLYARLSERGGNLFFSPYSISNALAMTFAGARGETADEMAKALHFDLAPARLHAAFAGLVRDVNGTAATRKQRHYELSTANALWAQKGFSIRPEYQKLTLAHYSAGVGLADFVGNTEASRRAINGWVESQTHQRIRELIPLNMLSNRTRLVLTNAIYFKGDWENPFKSSATEVAPFTLASGGRVNAPLMSQTDTFGYFEGDGFQVLEMPYAGGDMSMVAILPARPDGLPRLEKQMTAATLAGWLQKASGRKVQVTFPRFRTACEFDCKEALSEIGVKRAFSGAADFSGITAEPQGLLLSAVLHKAVVEVTEGGTEAAAATAVEATIGAPPMFGTPAPIPVFRADHPFLFLIRDTRSGSILFLGRLVDPR